VNPVSLGVMKAAMVNASSYARLAAIVDGTFYLERAGFVTGQILHIDGGHSPGH
jgi:hypothetical protein